MPVPHILRSLGPELNLKNLNALMLVVSAYSCFYTSSSTSKTSIFWKFGLPLFWGAKARQLPILILRDCYVRSPRCSLDMALSFSWSGAPASFMAVLKIHSVHPAVWTELRPGHLSKNWIHMDHRFETQVDKISFYADVYVQNVRKNHFRKCCPSSVPNDATLIVRSFRLYQ